MAKKAVWVSPYKIAGSRWKVQTPGGGVIDRFATKESAVASGVMLAKALQCELIVQHADGTIESRNSYGSDPFPPRG